MIRLNWSLIITALLITGCTSTCGVRRSSMSPEQVVEAYLDVALNMNNVSDRDQLLDFTTGNLKAAIEAASEDTIKTAYVDRKYSLDNYSVVERRDRTPKETEVVFQLTYRDYGVSKKITGDAPKVTTDNTVSVVKEGGLWMIRDVIGAKTAIDFPIAEESKITAKAGVVTPEDPPSTNTP